MASDRLVKSINTRLPASEEVEGPEGAHHPTMDAKASPEVSDPSVKLKSVPSENGGGTTTTTVDHKKFNSPRSNRSPGGEDNNISVSQSATPSRTPAVKKAATIGDDGGEHQHQHLRQRLQDVSPAKKLTEGTTTESAESARRQCKYT